MMITTLTFIRYRGLYHKTWAFLMMQFAHTLVRNTEGLQFYQLMGTGAGNGFKPSPDFSMYGFLGVWTGEEAADRFFGESELFARYRRHSVEMWTIYLKTLRAHGSWSGKQPFVPAGEDLPGNLIGVITRATIARGRIIRFWKQVPAASAPLKDSEGLLFSAGIGEWPVTRMATFSIWKDEESIRNYAYHQPAHLEAIKLTRELNWYSEELFARFRPYRSEGSWEGKDPLQGML